MNKYRKLVLCILIAVISLSLLGGCCTSQPDDILIDSGSDGQNSEEKSTTITFFGFKADAANLIAIETALHDFMNEYPDILVTYEGLKGQSYWDSFKLRAETGNLSDLIMVNHDEVIFQSKEGRLADLSDLSTIDGYLYIARDQFTEDDGAVYFLPTCISTYNLYINTTLLEQHNQSLPTNLAEFSQVCDYFVNQGIVPIIANNYNSLPSLIIAKGMYPIYQMENTHAEIEKFNRREKDLVKQLRPGIELVKDMLDRGWIDGAELLKTEQTSDDLKLFSQGTRPFMITGGWATPRLDVDFSYGVYPYPILEDGSVLSMDVNTCVSVNADSEHVEEAKKLLEFLTQSDVMWNYCNSQSSYTPLQDDRMPSEAAIVPSAPYLTNGRNVLGTDYNLLLPIEKSLRECGRQLANGADTVSVMKQLSSMLY